MDAILTRDICQLLLTACMRFGPRTTACLAATCRTMWSMYIVLKRDISIREDIIFYTQSIIDPCYDSYRRKAREYLGLQQVPMHMRDHDLCLASVKSHPSNGKYVPTQLITPDIAWEMVLYGWQLDLIPACARTLEICQRACENAYVLDIVSKKYRIDCVMSQVKHVCGFQELVAAFPQYVTEEVCIEALRHHDIIRFIPNHLLTDAVRFVAYLCY